jgi:hypothetical protein
MAVSDASAGRDPPDGGQRRGDRRRRRPPDGPPRSVPGDEQRVRPQPDELHDRGGQEGHEGEQVGAGERRERDGGRDRLARSGQVGPEDRPDRRRPHHGRQRPALASPALPGPSRRTAPAGSRRWPTRTPARRRRAAGSCRPPRRPRRATAPTRRRGSRSRAPAVGRARRRSGRSRTPPRRRRARTRSPRPPTATRCPTGRRRAARRPRSPPRRRPRRGPGSRPAPAGCAAGAPPATGAAGDGSGRSPRGPPREARRFERGQRVGLGEELRDVEAAPWRLVRPRRPLAGRVLHLGAEQLPLGRDGRTRGSPGRRAGPAGAAPRGPARVASSNWNFALSSITSRSSSSRVEDSTPVSSNAPMRSWPLRPAQARSPVRPRGRHRSRAARRRRAAPGGPPPGRRSRPRCGSPGRSQDRTRPPGGPELGRSHARSSPWDRRAGGAPLPGAVRASSRCLPTRTSPTWSKPSPGSARSTARPWGSRISRFSRTSMATRGTVGSSRSVAPGGGEPDPAAGCRRREPS